MAEIAQQTKYYKLFFVVTPISLVGLRHHCQTAKVTCFHLWCHEHFGPHSRLNKQYMSKRK